MKVYCEHGALTKWLRVLQREGFVELVHFPYDADSHNSRTTTASIPSEAQLQDLNLTIQELPGALEGYRASEHLPEILQILGAQNRRDALHVDTAFKNGCSAFVTHDKGSSCTKTAFSSFWESGSLTLTLSEMSLSSLSLSAFPLKGRARLVRALIKPPDEGKYEITELRGLGKEIWHDEDAQEYIDRERDAWEASDETQMDDEIQNRGPFQT